MRFKIWLENMESAEDIFKRLSSLILSAPTYQDAIKNLSSAGVIPNFKTDQYTQLGHNWKDAFYNLISGDTSRGMFMPETNPELASKLYTIANRIKSMGFDVTNDTEGSWYFFEIEGYKPDDAKKKIHVKIPPSNLEYAVNLAEFIKQNSANFRKFKFAAKGGSFESRRDNFVIYLSKQGESKIGELTKGINVLGLATDTGEDFTGSTGNKLSQTELVSLRLSAILLSKPGIPRPNFVTTKLRLWKDTELEFLMSDPVASPYLSGHGQSKTSQNPQSTSQEYSPKTLTIATNGGPININIDATIGAIRLKQYLGQEVSQYFSNPQMLFKKSKDGWYITPVATAVNKTILNGTLLSSPTKIKINDQIGIVGKSGRQITPLRVTSV